MLKTAAFTLLIFTACSKAKVATFDGPIGLQEDRRTELLKINTPQSDLMDAMALAFGTKTSASEKAARLAKMLRDANCAQSGAAPDERFDHSWSADRAVNGTSCPLAYTEHSEFSVTNHNWRGQKSLMSAVTDFERKFSVSGEMHVALGGAVLGTLTYEKFGVKEVGEVAARMTLWQNMAGSQLVQLQMETPHNKYLASVLQTRSGERSYDINNVPLSPQDFATYLSAFQMDEVMDQALKMK